MCHHCLIVYFASYSKYKRAVQWKKKQTLTISMAVFLIIFFVAVYQLGKPPTFFTFVFLAVDIDLWWWIPRKLKNVSGESFSNTFRTLICTEVWMWRRLRRRAPTAQCSLTCSCYHRRPILCRRPIGSMYSVCLSPSMKYLRPTHSSSLETQIHQRYAPWLCLGECNYCFLVHMLQLNVSTFVVQHMYAVDIKLSARWVS